MIATQVAANPPVIADDRPRRTRTPDGRIAGLIAAQRCVILDGAKGIETIDGAGVRLETDERLWGTTLHQGASSSEFPTPVDRMSVLKGKAA